MEHKRGELPGPEPGLTFLVEEMQHDSLKSNSFSYDKLGSNSLGWVGISLVRLGSVRLG